MQFKSTGALPQLTRLAIAIMCLGAAGAAYADTPTTVEAPTVDVVGTTPLPEIGVPVNQVPAHIQSATAKDMNNQQPGNLTDFMNNNFGSVNVNDTLANSAQMTVDFRGFTASPLLGTPQGLSVFQDGVRINEAFGDTVNWDLLPQSAISSINLIPGSNPVYGLNTLGGALAVQTKSGRDYPGTFLTAGAGSYGHYQSTLETGGSKGHWDYFFTANDEYNRSWRQFSSSHIKQAFGKVGWQDDSTDIDVSFSTANNWMNGPQGVPTSEMNNPASPYTYPDFMNNKLDFVNVKASQFLNDTDQLAGNLYVRDYRNMTFNSNLQDTGPAKNLIANLDQNGWGGTLQWSTTRNLAGHQNLFTAGASLDAGSSNFQQSAQDANVVGNLLVGYDPFTQQTNLNGSNHYYGLFATDTWSATKKLSFTASGRFNRAQVNLADASGTNPALNGNHTFNRFNPAVGVNYNFSPALESYLTYSQGMRAPTPVELACADPSHACSLPTGFLSDPNLNPVISRTVEGGLRGRFNANTRWDMAVYRTSLSNDIQFVSSPNGSTGYFTNVGNTRRQGVELGLSQHRDRFNLAAHLSLIDATYQTPFQLQSQSNSQANGSGNIQVNSGNHIPGIPNAMLKLRGEYLINARAAVAANIITMAGQYPYGDENNVDSHGKIAGYSIVNLDGHYTIGNRWQIFGKINNLFDKQYSTFGLLGNNYYATGTYNQNTTAPEQFLTPANPRTFFIGVKYALDGKIAGAPSGD